MHTLDILREYTEKLRPGNVSFLQIGANDGVSYDFANHVIHSSDRGIFVEPCRLPFEKLLQNKKTYTNSVFCNFAIIPSNLPLLNTVTVLSEDEFQGGSSLFSNLPTQHRTINTESIQSVHLSTFLKEYNIKELDIFFCDTEGLDHVLVLELINILTPKILIFESFSWLKESELILHNKTSVTVPSKEKVYDVLREKGYKIFDCMELCNDENSIAVCKRLAQ